VPFDQMTAQQDKQTAEMAIVQIALARSDLLRAKGDDAGALAALEAGKKRLSADSRMARQIDSKLKQAALIGQPAPELKKDRQYGEFVSLAALKGRVVVLDFGAHW
jgi:regulator of protease activity HflC (stomatin/prohibitin superfamily)